MSLARRALCRSLGVTPGGCTRCRGHARSPARVLIQQRVRYEAVVRLERSAITIKH